MPVTIGGTINIQIRDMGELPSSEGDLRAFCSDVLGNECFQKLNAVNGLVASGVTAATRDVPAMELSTRGVSVGISISGTF